MHVRLPLHAVSEVLPERTKTYTRPLLLAKICLVRCNSNDTHISHGAARGYALVHLQGVIYFEPAHLGNAIEPA